MPPYVCSVDKNVSCITSCLLAQKALLFSELVMDLFSARKGYEFWQLARNVIKAAYPDLYIIYNLQWMSCLAPGPGEGTSSGETPQGPRKKRARVDPTVESVCIISNDFMEKHENIPACFIPLRLFTSLRTIIWLLYSRIFTTQLFSNFKRTCKNALQLSK